jgi:hypothetical protein
MTSEQMQAEYPRVEFVAHCGDEAFGPFVRDVKWDVRGDILHAEIVGPAIPDDVLPASWRSFESYLEITKLLS